jgi:hypothetical protein
MTHLIRLISTPTDDELIRNVEQDPKQKTDRGNDRLNDRIDDDDSDHHTKRRPERTEFELVLQKMSYVLAFRARSPRYTFAHHLVLGDIELPRSLSSQDGFEKEHGKGNNSRVGLRRTRQVGGQNSNRVQNLGVCRWAE